MTRPTAPHLLTAPDAHTVRRAWQQAARYLVRCWVTDDGGGLALWADGAASLLLTPSWRVADGLRAYLQVANAPEEFVQRLEVLGQAAAERGPAAALEQRLARDEKTAWRRDRMTLARWMGAYAAAAARDSDHFDIRLFESGLETAVADLWASARRVGQEGTDGEGAHGIVANPGPQETAHLDGGWRVDGQWPHERGGGLGMFTIPGSTTNAQDIGRVLGAVLRGWAHETQRGQQPALVVEQTYPGSGAHHLADYLLWIAAVQEDARAGAAPPAAAAVARHVPADLARTLATGMVVRPDEDEPEEVRTSTRLLRFFAERQRVLAAACDRRALANLPQPSARTTSAERTGGPRKM